MITTERKIWTLYSGGTVQIAHSAEEAADLAADYVRGCGDDGEDVTRDNYQFYLNRYNAELDENGDNPYECLIEEHPLPPLKLVVALDHGTLSGVYGASETVGAEVAVVDFGFNAADYEESDIMTERFGAYEYRFVGYFENVNAEDPHRPGGDLGKMFGAIADKNNLQASNRP